MEYPVTTAINIPKKQGEKILWVNNIPFIIPKKMANPTGNTAALPLILKNC